MKALEIRLCLEIEMIMLPEVYERLKRTKEPYYTLSFNQNHLVQAPRLVYQEDVITEVEKLTKNDN